MAKRIVISFTDNPLTGVGFVYTMLLDSIPLLYDNGYTTLSLEYLNTGAPDEPPLKLERKSTLDSTIDKTLAFLNQNWSADFVYYARFDDTIHVIFDNDSLSYAPGSVNENINLTIGNISESENLNLRYFFQYTNDINDTFLCQIFKKKYLEDPLEINGSATLEKGSVKNHTDSIRGTGLAIELEASLEVTLEDLYTENEQDFTIIFYKNNKILFRGFLKPDGVFQSFVRDNWILSLDCVDGLGALSNLSFVKDTGFRFIGKMKAIDIVHYCLKRTGILLPINTSINTVYDGLTLSDNLDILTKIQLNSDRFFKVDGKTTGDGTLMSCEEVLKSILDVFGACITQENGEWYIYKTNEIYKLPYVLFRRYDITNTYVGNKTINLNNIIGSQINNFYPHHSGGNQNIKIQGGVSAFRLGYKYGFVSGLLPNPNLISDGNLNYEGWVVEDPFLSIKDPLSPNGFIFKNASFGNTNNLVVSNPFAVTVDDFLNLKISFSVRSGLGNVTGRFIRLKIKQGIYYLKYNPRNNATPIEDTTNAIWTTNSSDSFTVYLNGDGSVEVSLPNFLADGLLTIGIMTIAPELGITVIKSIDLTANVGAKSEIGEFHTVSRKDKVSSIVKENRSVSNGDNAGVVYIGAIFKEDALTPTSLWNRKGTFENYPLLRIAAEDELRLGQKPLKLFTGSVYGFLPYLSLIEIDGINGRFMAVNYSYNTKLNSITFKLLELFAEEIADIKYKFTYDYGNTVKPTITG